MVSEEQSGSEQRVTKEMIDAKVAKENRRNREWARKIALAEEAESQNFETPKAKDEFIKCYYFFYGTLMDPRRLSAILELDAPPALIPATITGYRIKMWGPYKALVPSEGSVVRGLAYEVQSQEAVRRLERYETSAYRTQDVDIHFEDGTDRKIPGKIFVWGDEDEDELDEVIPEVEEKNKFLYGHTHV